MMKIALVGGRVIDPANQSDEILNLAIADGKIVAKQAHLGDFSPDVTIDASEKIICPGIVDLHAAVLSSGVDSPFAFWQQLRNALFAGITHVGTQAFYNNRSLEPAEIEYYRQAPPDLVITARPCLIGPLTQNLDGTRLSALRLLNNAGCFVFSNGNKPISNTLVKRRCYDYASMLGLKILISPEDSFLTQDGLMHEGEVSLRLGIPGIPSLAETAALSQELMLVEATNICAHFLHLSSERSVALLKMAQESLPVTADVAIANLFLTHVDVELDNGRCHVRPPLRKDSDLNALRVGVKNGVITAIASNHIPVPLRQKELPFQDSQPGMATWPVLLPLVLRLAQESDIPLMTALSCITHGPANILDLDAGHLSLDKTANLIIIDPNEEWCLEQNELSLFGHNNPFQNWTLKGRVKQVIAQGKIIHPLSKF